MKQIELVTFDVYMALVDIQGSLSPVFANITGASLEQAGPMVSTWRAKQMERAALSNSLGGSRTCFRDCTSMALDYVLTKHQISLSQSARDTLLRAWDQLKPWPEANAALASVRAMGHKIAILSNGDQDMLEAIARQFDTPFDYVLSSESAGKYKPDPAMYALPSRQLSIANSETLHVAGSANDVLGAISYGMACIWSNRHRDSLLDPRFPPTDEIANLSHLQAKLE